MVEAAYRHHGLDYRYINCEVPPEKLGDAVKGARAMGWAGFNLSIPHKVTVIPHLDGLGESAAVMGAVNCAVARNGKLIGENTDGKGFLQSLRELIDPAGKTIVMFGAGGAARAIGVELALAGAKHITIVNRDPKRGQTLVDLLNGKTKVKAELAVWKGTYAIPANADIAINATSIGLYPDVNARLDIALDSLRKGLVVADVIPNPPRTNLDQGCRSARLQDPRRPRHAGEPGRHRRQILDRRRRRPHRHEAQARGNILGLERFGEETLIRPVGHLLPSFGREKAKLLQIIAFSRAPWHGRRWPKAG